MEPDFARRAPRRTSGDPEPGEGDFTRYAVEVTNLMHRATPEQVQELFRRLAGLCSVSYTPRSGKATVELSSRSNAETAVRLPRPNPSPNPNPKPNPSPNPNPNPNPTPSPHPHPNPKP